MRVWLFQIFWKFWKSEAIKFDSEITARQNWRRKSNNRSFWKYLWNLRIDFESISRLFKFQDRWLLCVGWRNFPYALFLVDFMYGIPVNGIIKIHYLVILKDEKNILTKIQNFTFLIEIETRSVRFCFSINPRKVFKDPSFRRQWWPQVTSYLTSTANEIARSSFWKPI